MTLQEYFQKIDEIYDEAKSIKDKVRQSQRNYELNIEASNKMGLVVSLIQEVLKFDLKNEEIVYSLKIDLEYYSYEKYDCLSHYFYESHKIDEAVENIQEGLKHLEDAIKLLKSIPVSFSDKFKNEYCPRIKRWEYFYNNSTNKIYAFYARKALDNKNYVEAIDNYKRFARGAKEIIEKSKKLEPMYERVSIGNYIVMLGNISQTMIQIIQERDIFDNDKLSENSAIELLKYGLEAYNYAKIAGEENPEWDQFKDQVNVLYKNISNFLADNKEHWFNIFIAFQDSHELKKIMQRIDINNFHKVESKLLGNNKTYKLWKNGSFFIITFLVIAFTVYSFVTLKLSITNYLLSLVGIEVLYLIVSATILRSIELLSENNFLELIKLTLSNQFNVFKLFTKKNESKNNPQINRTP